MRRRLAALHYAVRDDIGMMRQLGVVPPAPDFRAEVVSGKSIGAQPARRTDLVKRGPSLHRRVARR
jgi:hypothetical protein